MCSRRWTNLLKRSFQARRYQQVSKSVKEYLRDCYHFRILYHETQNILKNRLSLNQDSPKPFKHIKMTVWSCSFWKIFKSVFISEAVQKLRHKMPFPPFLTCFHLYICTMVHRQLRIVAVNTSSTQLWLKKSCYILWTKVGHWYLNKCQFFLQTL